MSKLNFEYENIDASHVAQNSPQIHENEIDIEELAPHEHEVSGLKYFFHIMKHGFKTYEEAVEFFSIFYSLYIIAANYEPFETKAGYGVVLAGGLTGATVSLLNINRKISPATFHKLHIIKEALGGAAVAGLFAQSFVDPTLRSVFLGYGTVLLLTPSKALSEIFENRYFFHTKIGKTLEYLIDITYSGLMAAGIGDYFLDIYEGFGGEVTTATHYGILGTLSFLNIMADLPLTKFSEPHRPENNNPKSMFLYYLAKFCMGLAKFYRSSIYGSEIALFLMIFILDAYTNIEDTDDIKDPIFYTILGVSLAQGLLVMINKLLSGKREEHEHVHAQDSVEDIFSDERRPLTHHSTVVKEIPTAGRFERTKSLEASSSLPTFSWMSGHRSSYGASPTVAEDYVPNPYTNIVSGNT